MLPRLTVEHVVQPGIRRHGSPAPVRSNTPVLMMTAAGRGRPSSRARRISAAGQVPAGRRPADDDLLRLGAPPAGADRRRGSRRAAPGTGGRAACGSRPPTPGRRGVGRDDGGHLAHVAATEDERAAVDVEEDAAVVGRHALGRHDVHRARPDVTLLERAGETRRRIPDHRLHELVGPVDERLPPGDVVQRRIRLRRRRAEPAHGQHGLCLGAHRGRDGDLPGREVHAGRASVSVMVNPSPVACGCGRPSSRRRPAGWR